MLDFLQRREGKHFAHYEPTTKNTARSTCTHARTHSRTCSFCNHERHGLTYSFYVPFLLLQAVADDLGKLLKGRNVHVNLIPYNPTTVPDATLEAPEGADVAAFQKRLREDWSLNVTVRVECGREISGACGQLVVEGSSCTSGGGAGGGGDGGCVDIEDVVPDSKKGAGSTAGAAHAGALWPARDRAHTRPDDKPDGGGGGGGSGAVTLLPWALLAAAAAAGVAVVWAAATESLMIR